MKIDRLVRAPQLAGAFRARLLIVCFFFALGAVTGSFAHRAVTVQDDQLLQEYLLQYAQFALQSEDMTASILSVLVVYFRYPLLVFLGGYVAFGLILIPTLCLAQGFFLSFSIGCFTSALGRSGILLLLAACGVRYVITLPCTLLLAVWALDSARHLLSMRKEGRRKRSTDGASVRLWQFLICSAVLLIGVILELSMVPRFLQLALAGIS